MSTETIPRELVKRSIIYSIASTVLSPLFSLVILSLPLSFDIQLIFLMWGFIFFLIGVVSLIFYFINPEITYGMWISRKKAKNFNNRYIKIGRRIQIAIMLTGLGIFTALFILIISVLFL